MKKRWVLGSMRMGCLRLLGLFRWKSIHEIHPSRCFGSALELLQEMFAVDCCLKLEASTLVGTPVPAIFNRQSTNERKLIFREWMPCVNTQWPVGAAESLVMRKIPLGDVCPSRILLGLWFPMQIYRQEMNEFWDSWGEITHFWVCNYIVISVLAFYRQILHNPWPRSANRDINRMGFYLASWHQVK